MAEAGLYATARKGGITYDDVLRVRRQFPRASAQFIATTLGRSMEDVQRVLETSQ